MKTVWMAADNIISPLGSTSEENFENMRRGISGIKLTSRTSLGTTPIFVSGMKEEDDSPNSFFESIAIRSIKAAMNGLSIPSERTLFILSTTKGNIRFLEEGNGDHPRIGLPATARYIAGQVGLIHSLVVSNACISGVLGMIVAQRYLNSGTYDHVVLTGADVLSRFVVSGFQSLQALSSSPCKPFDETRTGISLGEAAATIILSVKPDVLGANPEVMISGAGLSNDANHISGPSRTGAELSYSIDQALSSSGIKAGDIDFISAHGTGTRYNDEMEALAFWHSHLENVPLNSLKGYIGHTLGAAGVAESIISKHSLVHNEILQTAGYSTPGVTKEIAVTCRKISTPLTRCLKTASGFGGCNAAVVLSKRS